MISILTNISFSLHEAWTYSKKLCVFKTIRSIISGIIPGISALLYRNIIDSVTSNSFKELIFWVIIEAFVLLTTCIANTYINTIKVSLTQDQFKALIMYKYLAKTSSLDMAVAATPAVTTLQQRALDATQRNVCLTYFDLFFQMMSAIITLVSVSAILLSASVWAIAFIILMAILNLPVLMKESKDRVDVSIKAAPINKKFNYYSTLLYDPMYIKEMRMYSISDWVLDKVLKLIESNLDLYCELYGNIFKTNALRTFFDRIKNLFVYIFLGWQVIYKGMSFANFTMFLSTLGSFSSSIQSFVGAIINIYENSIYAEALRQYLGLVNVIAVDGKGDSVRRDESENYVYRIENISFKYPGSEHYVLENVSASFEKGKVYVIVGENGGGKSTLCNLICRLYDVSEGCIKYLGQDIRKLNYKNYRNQVGIVFQDYKYYDLSIAENIAMNQYDGSPEIRERIIKCLEAAGLKKKVESLPNGIDTYLGRLFEDDGVILSGGETQKLALAKMLFRESPVVILDEPSSALDAFTENELMTTFMNSLKGKTVFYISHRLSVAKRADAVVFVNNHTIENILPHDEMIRKNSRYAEMYNLQAKQYGEEKI